VNLQRQARNKCQNLLNDSPVSYPVTTGIYFIAYENFSICVFNLYRTNVTASVMQPCTRCWPNVAATVTQCMHEFIQLPPCLLETETQTNSTVVPTTGLAFVRSHYVIFGGLGFDIIYGCT